MGVMACSRNNCDSILCDTYVNDIGYICGDCESEFKSYLNINNIIPNTEGEIFKHLNVFMDRMKHCFDSNHEVSIEDYFDSKRG